mmetsp:Transcript_23013/g.63914  ORF Transcript_23013/g.63914 Transcript_23013/m.63914 type:complete len:478 (+) Transcript_23013:225-1658(+)
MASSYSGPSPEASSSDVTSRFTRGEGHMSDLANEPTENPFKNIDGSTKEKLGFYSIAVAKVQTIDWLKSRGKGNVTNSTLQVVADTLKKEIMAWWEILQNQKGPPTMLEHLIEVWQLCAGDEVFRKDQVEVLVRKFGVNVVHDEITYHQFESFCVDQIQMAQQAAGMAKANRLTVDDHTLSALLPIKSVFAALKRAQVIAMLYNGNVHDQQLQWQMNDSAFDKKILPIATLMMADLQRSKLLKGIASKFRDLVTQANEAQKENFRGGASNALTTPAAKDEKAAREWEQAPSIRQVLKATAQHGLAKTIAAEQYENAEEGEPGSTQKRKYMFQNRLQRPKYSTPLKAYKLWALREDGHPASVAVAAVRGHPGSAASMTDAASRSRLFTRGDTGQVASLAAHVSRASSSRPQSRHWQGAGASFPPRSPISMLTPEQGCDQLELSSSNVGESDVEAGPARPGTPPVTYAADLCCSLHTDL